MNPAERSDHWWKTAVVYCVGVESFLDADDDGTGDFAGLCERLDYLDELGVTCIWLMPFYPSPRRDDGYDIADYYGVDDRYGDLGDVVEFTRAAHDRGIRVIVDLVINHTSDAHPWFRAARSSPANPHRDFYVWTDEPPADQPENEFPDAEDGIWCHDDRADAYYRHTFFRHQPDLNIANVAVREQIAKVVGFWLELGVDGFRVDAVPHFMERVVDAEHDYLRSLRRGIALRSGTGIMLGEVNEPYERQDVYFGGEAGDELTMQFDFFGNQRLFLSLARHDARPLADALAARPSRGPSTQWANFVRNHDELTLTLLDDDERQEVFDAFAPEAEHRIHGRGIVRRLPAMLDDDPRRLRMVYSLVFSLPGAPVLLYGEEIGLGENPELPGRRAIRPLMQWSDEKNGGFSRAAPSRLVLPVAEGGAGPAHVSVSAQRHDPDALLGFVRTLARLYRASPEIGWGDLTILDQPHPAVLAHTIRSASGQLVALHSFAADGRVVPLRLDDVAADTAIVDMLTGQRHGADQRGRLELTLPGYGALWLRVIRSGDKRLV